MKKRLLIVLSSVSLLAFAGTAAAHGSGYRGHDDRLSGSVTIWSGAPWGVGYAGNLHYGSGYYAPPRYPRASFYPACGHWHPPGYRHAAKHGYRRGYAQGYYRGRHSGRRDHYGHDRHRDRHHRHHH